MVAGEDESLNNWSLGFVARKLSEYIGGRDAEGEKGHIQEALPLVYFGIFVYLHNTCVLKSVCLPQDWGRRKDHGKKSILVLGEAETRNSE